MFFKNSNPGLPHNHAGSWVCSLNYPLTARWLKPPFPLVPLLCMTRICLNYSLTARWLKPSRSARTLSSTGGSVWTTPSPQGAWTEKSRYPKRYRDFFYKKLKKRRETGIYSERQECQPESQLLWKTCWHLSDFMVKSIQSGMTSAVLHAAERNTRWRTFSFPA